MGISTAPGGPPRRPACPCTPAQQQEMAWRWCGAAARVVVGKGGGWSRCGGQRGLGGVRTSFCSVRAFSWREPSMRRPMEETVEVLGTAKETPPRAPAWGPVGASLDLGAHTTALGPCCTRSKDSKHAGRKNGTVQTLSLSLPVLRTDCHPASVHLGQYTVTTLGTHWAHTHTVTRALDSGSCQASS